MMKSGVWTHEDEATQVRVMERPSVELTSDLRNEVWVAPGNGGSDKGIGTFSRPFRVSTPEAFDKLLLKHPRRENVEGVPGVRFRLTAGVFRTRGTWAYEETQYAMLRGSDELVGDGSRRTELVLSVPVLETQGMRRPDANILWVGSPYHGDQVGGNRVQGLKLASEHLLTTNGLRIHAPMTWVEDVAVTGAHGSYLPVDGPSGEIPYEAFGISFGQGGTGDVVRCRVIQRAAGSYLSAFSANAGRSRFSECVAEGNWSGVGHAAFTIYQTTTVERCVASGYAYGIYNDTDSVLGCRVQDCEMVVSYAAVSIVAEPGRIKRGVRVSGCNFAFLPPTENSTQPFIALQLRGKEGVFRHIVVDWCTFETPSKGDRFYIVSTDAKDIEGSRIERVTVPDTVICHVPDGVSIGGKAWEKSSGYPAEIKWEVA